MVPNQHQTPQDAPQNASPLGDQNSKNDLPKNN